MKDVSSKSQKKSVKNFISKLFSKKSDQSDQNPTTICIRGVAFMEKSSFADVFLSVGNVDFFFYVLYLISESDDQLDKEQSYKIAAEVFKVVQHFIQTYSLPDIRDFLNNNEG